MLFRSRETAESRSDAGWARRGRVRSPQGSAPSSASRLGSPDLEEEAGPLGFAAGSRGVGRVPCFFRTLGVAGDETATRAEGREAPPEARWARETLRDELRAARNWSLGRSGAVSEQAGVRGRPPPSRGEFR